MSKPNEGDLSIWWTPQVPGKAFRVIVDSVEQAAFALNLLADYDNFTLANGITRDTPNAGGLQIFEAGEWVDWYDDETGEFEPSVVLEMRRAVKP